MNKRISVTFKAQLPGKKSQQCFLQYGAHVHLNRKASGAMASTMTAMATGTNTNVPSDTDSTSWEERLVLSQDILRTGLEARRRLEELVPRQMLRLIASSTEGRP